MLDIVADEETAHRTPGFPTPGSLLAESIAGANGIGTPLAENAYVELVGPEHFIQGFHVYTCQGLPLRAPDDTIVGVLSTSVRIVEAAERVHEILVCGAHGIEAELSHRRLEREVSDVLGRIGAEGKQLEALRQDVTQLQARARLRLEKAARVTKERPGSALDLVAAADDLMRRFHHQADLWRDIAFSEVGMAQPVDLRARVVDVADLLTTEAAIRGMRIVVQPGPAPRVTTDSRELSRSIFRCLLRALDLSEPGATVEASIAVEADRVRVSFSVSSDTILAFTLSEDAQPRDDIEPAASSDRADRG